MNLIEKEIYNFKTFQNFIAYAKKIKKSNIDEKEKMIILKLVYEIGNEKFPSELANFTDDYDEKYNEKYDFCYYSKTPINHVRCCFF